jgi:hypothetical protein
MSLTLQADDPRAVRRLRGRDGSARLVGIGERKPTYPLVGLVCPLEAAKGVAITLPLYDVFATCPDIHAGCALMALTGGPGRFPG